MSFAVKGRTAIATGAGSGITLAFAQLLLSRGCNVLFADLALRPEAKRLVDRYSRGGTSGPRAAFRKCDVTRWDDLKGAFEGAMAEFGGVDVVCPGAGVYEPSCSNFWYPPGTKESIDTISGGRYTTLDINLIHPIQLTQVALQHFTSERKPGSIVHISSIAGQRANLLTPLYNASKHGINGFVRSLSSLEEAVGVRVTAVAPGIIKTPLWTEHPEKLKTVGEEDDWVSPEAVAEVMLDLIEKDKVSAGTIEGGTILEVSKRIRKVEPFNDPGPSGEGNTASNIGLGHKDVLDILSSNRRVDGGQPAVAAAA